MDHKHQICLNKLLLNHFQWIHQMQEHILSPFLPYDLIRVRHRIQRRGSCRGDRARTDHKHRGSSSAPSF